MSTYNVKSANFHGGIGLWAVYYTSPQSLEIMFSYSMAQKL